MTKSRKATMANRRPNTHKVESSREVYNNPWIRVKEDVVIYPSGQKKTFGLIERRTAGTTVLAMANDGYVYLAREYKHGIGKHSIELISGGTKHNESPLNGAKRELFEEARLKAVTWSSFGSIDPFTTYMNARNYLFWARDLIESKQDITQREEDITIMKMPFDDVVKMAYNNEITHAASIILILRVHAFLNNIDPIAKHDESNSHS